MKRTFKNIFLCSFFIVFVFVPSLVFASVAGEVNKANSLYKQGKFDDSLDLYQQALDQDGKSSVVKYDLGTALYKKGDYDKALGYLQQAAQDKNLNIRPKAEYNSGNALFKSGIQKENSNVDQAIKFLQQALGHYGQALAIDPQDADTKFNQDIVKKEIERLKQKKQQQNQQKKQQQKQQQKNQKQQQQNQNQQDQQNQRQKQQKQQENQQQQNNQQQPSSQKEQNAQTQAEEDQKEFDRKQAEDLLEEYQENEEPKKLLNYMPKKIDDRPVLKDW